MSQRIGIDSVKCDFNTYPYEVVTYAKLSICLLYTSFIEQALCLFIGETSYKDSLSPFGIRMVDRLTGKPVHLDISDLPMKLSLIHI